MLIEELFRDAIEYNEIELQAVIMFVVIEKKAEKMTDPVTNLDKYFAEKNRPRMSQYIDDYMERMNMKRFKGVYEVFDGQAMRYVYADNEEQAMYVVRGHNALIMLDNDELYVNGSNRSVKELIKGKKTPYIIGGN